ncbi:hypothetical protein KC318_g16933, partial [Hortaea werneckii]
VVQDAKQGMSKVDSKLEAYRNQAEKGLDQNLAEARKGANNAIDSFDKNVSEGANKAKSGINSWFGGKLSRSPVGKRQAITTAINELEYSGPGGEERDE